eukprot:8703765-Pyramimonas_sp.AAC.1
MQLARGEYDLARRGAMKFPQGDESVLGAPLLKDIHAKAVLHEVLGLGLASGRLQESSHDFELSDHVFRPKRLHRRQDLQNSVQALHAPRAR